jgi:DNA-binding transcriptional LysR family regulator
LLQSLREKFPRLKLTLREGSQPEVAPWVERQEVDMAITLLDGRESGGLNNVPLLDLPVVFLVPKKHPAQRSEDILAAVASGNEPMTLITLPQCELAPRSLQEFIKQRGLEWPVSIEVTAIELVEAYVTAGFGIGLTLDLPGHPFPKTTRAIPVDGIAPLRLSALWKGSMNSVMKELLELLQKSAKSLKSPSA